MAAYAELFGPKEYDKSWTSLVAEYGMFVQCVFVFSGVMDSGYFQSLDNFRSERLVNLSEKFNRSSIRLFIKKKNRFVFYELFFSRIIS